MAVAAHVVSVAILDDDPDIRDLVSTMIDLDPSLVLDDGYAGLAELLRGLEHRQPDVIVVDHNLGLQITGSDAVGTIRAAAPKARLILFTAAPEGRDVRAAAFDAVLPKMNGAELCSLISRLALSSAPPKSDAELGSPTLASPSVETPAPQKAMLRRRTATADDFAAESLAPPPSRAGLRRWRRTSIVLGAVALLGVIVLVALSLQVVRVEAQAQAAQRQRFTLRTALASKFVTTYVEYVHHQSQIQAEALLAGPVEAADFSRVVIAGGFQAAVLLNGRGEVLAAHPASPALLGKQLADKYRHLGSARDGRPAVSGVVNSAVEGIPIVAFASPYQAADGRRVFSGAFDVQRGPLRSYLQVGSEVRGTRTILVDDAERVIASTVDGIAAGTDLRAAGVAFPAQAIGLKSWSGMVGKRFVATTTIEGTSWSLLTDVPEESLFEAVPSTTSNWLLVGVIGVTGLLALVLVGRLARTWKQLDRLASIDGLTGLVNRRSAEERLASVRSAARRGGAPVGAAILDIDHFKQINDVHGHAVGDLVLREVAVRLQGALRPSDTAGRWGGEEFVVWIPGADVDCVGSLGERIRRAAGGAVAIPGGGEIDVKISVGCASGPPDDDELIRRADHALYAAKEMGRDRTVVARNGELSTVRLMG